MKQLFVLFILSLLFCSPLLAQNEDMQLAQQYAASGDNQKAADIYQKLYKQNNEAFYPYYINSLFTLKKFDEAEAITKKLMKKHPEQAEYIMKLAVIYEQQGNTDKATAIYDNILKNLPADNTAIVTTGMQFYQAGNNDYAIKTFQQGRKLLGNDAMFSQELLTLYRFKRDKANLTEEYLNFLPKNPGYINQAQNTLAGLYDGSADYAILKSALFKRIQKDPQQPIYADMLTWAFLQQKDFEQALNQALALNRRANNNDNSIFELCGTLVSNQAYDTAIRGYEYLVSKGKESDLYISSKVELINAKNLKVTSGKYLPADLLSLEQDYISLLTEFGKNRNTAFAMQKLANLQALKMHKYADAQKLLEEAIALPGISVQLMAHCKLDLGDIYLLNGKPWDATLLYSQVEKSMSNTDVGQDAKLRNAKLAYYTGDFVWAKGQLNVLKAATSQLIANDALNLQLLISDNTAADSAGNALKMYAHADLLIFAGEPEKALRTLDSIDKKFPNNTLNDDILMAKAKLFIGQKEYANAVTALKKIVETHPQDLWGDDAIFMLGDIYENNLNDKELAKTYYQKIITDYPGSLWLNEARKRFRVLRGDSADAS
ncbi:tetratricopeptide repeat protein [Mucilaginibacter gynuensis]|uniref:Tetratricopeptide repeat protein n=1 Tax=Mucilaginibacter gynuensis TaxID=1302236 RepID=A0ABP8GJ21_9SPHI